MYCERVAYRHGGRRDVRLSGKTKPSDASTSGRDAAVRRGKTHAITRPPAFVCVSPRGGRLARPTDRPSSRRRARDDSGIRKTLEPNRYDARSGFHESSMSRSGFDDTNPRTGFELSRGSTAYERAATRFRPTTDRGIGPDRRFFFFRIEIYVHTRRLIDENYSPSNARLVSETPRLVRSVILVDRIFRLIRNRFLHVGKWTFSFI